jgi:hypothetical protein
MRKSAQFAWLIPAAVLLYKMISFSPDSSVLGFQTTSVWHQYFGGGFAIPEFSGVKDLMELANVSDTQRGFAQLRVTAPFYAGVAYSLGAWASIQLSRLKVKELLHAKMEKPKNIA